ncbi:MAG: adenylate/guanylate cyclase domain-containing protein [Spirochaetota bacterium]
MEVVFAYVVSFLRNTWKSISYSGIPAHIGEEEKESFVFANRFITITSVYCSLFIPASVFFATFQLYLLDASLVHIKKHFFTLYPTVLYEWLYILIHFPLWMKVRKKGEWKYLVLFMYSFLLCLSILVTWLSFIFPLTIPISFTHTCIVFIFLLYVKKVRWYAVKFLLFFTLLLLSLLSFYHQLFLQPLFALPNFMVYWGGPFAVFLLYLFIFVLSFYFKNQVQNTNDLIDKEQELNVALLQTIIPKIVVEEIITQGAYTPRLLDDGVVIFIKIENFLELTLDMSPQEAMAILGTCYSFFDSKCKQYGLEKIKTVGELYMFAANVPEKKEHAYKNSILACQDILREYREEPYSLKMGVHCGSVVAGMIGENKYAYDIWGDAVNVASRILSGGKTDSINISLEMKEKLEGMVPLAYSGKYHAKNKGILDIYQVLWQEEQT